MGQPCITISEVTKSFGGVVALKDLNLTIDQGEFVAFLGASGCGKSTALRLIAGLSKPTTGSVDLHGISSRDGDISYVFQEPTLMPWATVYDNVYLPLRLKGESRQAADGRVRAALATVNLTDFADVYPRQLSGGMKMRCSIARAMVTEPKLVLMDEPFAALDELTRFRLNDELLALWDRFKWTVIFVTHSVFEATYLSSRTMVFSPRTSRIFGEVDIDTPYPRDPDLRTDTHFQAITRRASDMLAAAQHA
ncbi:MAG: nitrate/sulfonate/bicarbonate ABC transporter ATP-binding protein [Hyphomicrobiales bacterium]|nr:MAG: nitrate/sulfonate/bicarbonate ABC transporter ATP-binding protein [Hyphomicrobiales bacterium]